MMNRKPYATSVIRKILAAFLLAFVAILLALGITHFSFREMMGTVDQLSAPNEKLVKLNDVFEEITMLDQQQRAEAIENPQKPYKYFLDQTGFIQLMIDSLRMYPWDSVQHKRLSTLSDILDQRNQTFVSYLKVKADLADNKEFSKQLDTLSLILRQSQYNADSSIVTTQRKTITTYLQSDSLAASTKSAERNFLKKLFSRKKAKPVEQPQVKVQEELNVTVDTLAIAHQNVDMLEIEKLMRDLENDQASQRKKLQRKELELIHANTLFINQLLNTLHEVENEEVANIRLTNNHAANVMSESISRMNLLMLGFFLAAAVLVYFIIIDITKSNYYKKQLEKARDEAEQLTKIKQRFLANMSHEIRTPLQSIIGFTEQLKYQGEENPEAINAIHSSSEHLLHIVNEVLDYSRISSGQFTLAREKFRLFALIREVESAMRIQAERKRLTFVMNTEQASDHTLIGDPFRLRQILYNLIGNAIKFTHKGHVKLTVHTQDNNEHVSCIFDISDTGIGIKAEDLDKIFNQFEQANASITGQYGGTGLGLTIVKSLVDAQQGQLSVSSEPGVGSVFSVQINYEKAVTPELTISPSPEGTQTTFSGKVIVVDDDSMILKLCSIILDKNQITHNTYNDPEKVLHLAPHDSVSHILLDIRMPKMSGVELCQKLKSKYSPETKFIALTAHVLPEEQDNLLLAGFDSILTKPFHEADLLKALGISSQIKHHASEIPDFALVRQMTMGDESLFQSVISQFVDETEDDIIKLRRDMDDHNKKSVREIVHKIAGRTGQMGLFSLSAALRETEIALVDGASVETIQKELSNIVSELSEVLEGIRHTVIEHHS